MKKIIQKLALPIVLYAFLANAQASADYSQLYSNARSAGLSSKVLHAALHSYNWAESKGKVHNPNVLTVIDYTLPSTKKRLWLLDLKNNKVLMHALVSHGHNSGYIYAKHFSNRNNSLETSLGVYTTAKAPHYGEDGLALRVHGLESGINSNAFLRNIEIHGAAYVSNYDIRTYGRIGRTYGCFGLSPQKIHKMIDYTKGGSVLFAYAAPENNDPVAEG